MQGVIMMPCISVSQGSVALARLGDSMPWVQVSGFLSFKPVFEKIARPFLSGRIRLLGRH